MPSNRAYDSRQYSSTPFPYAPAKSPLSGDMFLVDGRDTYIKYSDVIAKRPGTLALGDSTTPQTTYPEQLWIYETLEASPVVYAIGSFKNGSVYELRYQKLSSVDTWHLLGNRRGSNHSVYPHVGCVRRGKLYIKGFPLDADDAEKLGSVQLDGTGGTLAIHDWGFFAPSQPAALSPPVEGLVIDSATNANPAVLHTTAPHGKTTGDIVTITGATGSWVPINSSFRITVTGAQNFSIPVNSTGFGGLGGSPVTGWPASAHSVTVLNSWVYTYTTQSVSGQESNHAPLQTNPDLSPSASGPFVNLIPSMVITGPSDTTEYPYLNVYRTTDGGGTFFFLKRIANTGGDIAFQDKYLGSGASSATFRDPTPDADLDTTRVSPTTQSNSPPPAVAPPFVTGTDSIQRSTRIVEYASRLWYGINEYVFYSGNEEIAAGVPEECFPSGIADPNYFRFTEALAYPASTPDGLVVITKKSTSRITGTNKSMFNPRPFLGGVGGVLFQPRAAVEVAESVAWLTQDLRLAFVHGDQYAVLSDPLGTIFKDAYEAGAKLETQFFTLLDRKYVMVACHRPDNPTLSKTYFYSLNHSLKLKDDAWFTPWHIKSTAYAVGTSTATSANNRLAVMLWDGTKAQLTYVDWLGTTASDVNPTTGAPVAYGWSFTTSLLGVPAGDHVNELRKPYLSPVLAAVEICKTSYTGDSPPTLTGYYDDTTYAVGQVLQPPLPPPRRAQSQGYDTLSYTSGMSVVKDFGLAITGNSDLLQAEISRLTFNWTPDSGA